MSVPNEQEKPQVVYLVERGQVPAADHTDIDLVGFLRTLWNRKLLIAGIAVLMTCLAVAYALLAPKWYRAEVVLIPRESAAGSRIPSQFAQLGGLASLVGISLGTGTGGSQEALGVLKSQGFARRFVQRNDLVDALARARSSSSAAQGNSGRFNDAVDFLRQSVLAVTYDKNTSLVTVSILWQDPVQAAEWANTISNQINEEFRLQAIRESGRNLEYLRSELAATNAVALQQALASLIETEMKNLMLARGTVEYVYRIVDKAEPPTRPARPRKGLVVVLGFLAGLMGGSMLALLIDPLRRLARSVRMPIPAVD
jgi:uncharacterized protein involved in exopolysaccharide biosynthesis